MCQISFVFYVSPRPPPPKPTITIITHHTSLTNTYTTDLPNSPRPTQQECGASVAGYLLWLEAPPPKGCGWVPCDHLVSWYTDRRSFFPLTLSSEPWGEGVPRTTYFLFFNWYLLLLSFYFLLFITFFTFTFFMAESFPPPRDVVGSPVTTLEATPDSRWLWAPPSPGARKENVSEQNDFLSAIEETEALR